MLSAPTSPTMTTPSPKPLPAPTRAVSLDSANIDAVEKHPTPPPPASSPLTKQMLARSKMRAYTSPHLTRGRHTIQEEPEDRGYKWQRAPAIRGIVPIDLSGSQVDVFLGGSCNPTTWRRDVAVPLLKAANIHYFNPQVDEWYHELIAEETRAKEAARIVLMVIDDATRSLVCINEAIEYITRGRRTVLVVQNVKRGAHVDGVTLAETELADLNGARECLRQLAIRHGLRVYEDVPTAIQDVITCLVEENPRVFVPEEPRLRKLSSIIFSKWAGQIKPRGEALRSCSSSSLLSVVSGDDSDEQDSDTGSPDRSVVKHTRSGPSHGRGGLVYLGGNLEGTTWRETVAIPLLQHAGVPFYIPHQDYLSCELQRMSSKPVGVDRLREVEKAREEADLVLFVIPDKSRSIAAMTEAVELICTNHAVLLVLEPLGEGCVLGDGCTLTGREYKDLTRARAYLRETAERHCIEIFDTVQQAVGSLIERLQ
ncbi:hypothetical protein Poli38472_008963 [Pythium oligandrum]|uniref:Uncharacterized protein n=1 Tax=Pythium oligandrum TaxID=41045 RepID=A0A8K1CLA8_PYTOL|nr:hypothetical protein Poli38472_008963 [Pythium oligandrum]|eukprot:TMW64796.1 hypothetical protein Poli38472_008963 [Pythium oligandrum]